MISIHAPSRGRLVYDPPKEVAKYFNPRPLAGATAQDDGGPQDPHISIHAPSRGRPVKNRKEAGLTSNFNPRPLAGATHTKGSPGQSPGHFNPRPLAGATNGTLQWGLGKGISIHAPSRGRL